MSLIFIEKFIVNNMFEGSLEAKLPTVWTDGKAQPGRNWTWRKSEGEEWLR